MCKPKFGFAEAEGAVLAPAPSFLLTFANAVRFWDVGPALAQSWAPVEQFYGYFVVCVGLCRARVRTILGLSWAMLGHFGPCWHHIGLMLSHFGPFWELFCLCKAFAKKTVNASKKCTFWSLLLMVFASFFGLCLFLSFGVCCT